MSPGGREGKMDSTWPGCSRRLRSLLWLAELQQGGGFPRAKYRTEIPKSPFHLWVELNLLVTFPPHYVPWEPAGRIFSPHAQPRLCASLPSSSPDAKLLLAKPRHACCQRNFICLLSRQIDQEESVLIKLRESFGSHWGCRTCPQSHYMFPKSKPPWGV